MESWFQFYIYPQPSEGIILYCRNTTETRKAEQALRRSEQLAAAGRLAASIAHEINNPLEAVTNLLFLAKNDAGALVGLKALLEIADKELQRLSHIAARSLKFYRQRTAPASVALDEVIDSVIYFHDPAIRLRNIAIERRYSGCARSSVPAGRDSASIHQPRFECPRCPAGQRAPRCCRTARAESQRTARCRGHRSRQRLRHGPPHVRSLVSPLCHYQGRSGNGTWTLGLKRNPRQA